MPTLGRSIVQVFGPGLARRAPPVRSLIEDGHLTRPDAESADGLGRDAFREMCEAGQGALVADIARNMHATALCRRWLAQLTTVPVEVAAVGVELVVLPFLTSPGRRATDASQAEQVVRHGSNLWSKELCEAVLEAAARADLRLTFARDVAAFAAEAARTRLWELEVGCPVSATTQLSWLREGGQEARVADWLLAQLDTASDLPWSARLAVAGVLPDDPSLYDITAVSQGVSS